LELTKNSFKISIFEQCFIIIQENEYKMTAQDLKLSIHQLLENIDDSTVLTAYHEILEQLIKVHQSQVVGYQTDGTPISRETLEKEVLSAKERVEDSQFVTHDDLKSQLENW